ncbi:MAG: Glu/Leu/Phe/Val dehydrogenase dimerization domain-containing protein [Desulfobulbaceae bacterium]|nr:Glu/Leu/Phe/Val dehydrogenase dimerization domain-containing protein [Desulfobulbaceae bacterium]
MTTASEMTDIEKEKSPALVVEYSDAGEGFQGWLVIDSLDHRLCAGGMRVQQGLTRERLVRMARNMTCKMRICGLRVDGAKCGIDYDPAAPGKHAAISRFMAAIRPFICSCYSMGPDLNVEMAELEAIARGIGLPSVKMAVAGAQGWELAYFSRRYQVLGREINGWPLGKIRAGYGVAAAALAMLDHLAIPCPQASVAVQGFGTLARAAALGLVRQGVRITAIADRDKCIVAGNGAGLDMEQLLCTSGPLLPENGFGGGVTVAAREELYRVPCDILIPAAVENTINEKVAARLQVKAVVPGANLAVTGEADQLLYQRNIPVLPDLLAGSGGSLAMEGLFAPEEHPQPAEILAHVGRRMTRLVRRTLARSRTEKTTPALAALRICEETVPQPGTRPYGRLH